MRSSYSHHSVSAVRTVLDVHDHSLPIPFTLAFAVYLMCACVCVCVPVRQCVVREMCACVLCRPGFTFHVCTTWYTNCWERRNGQTREMEEMEKWNETALDSNQSNDPVTRTYSVASRHTNTIAMSRKRCLYSIQCHLCVCMLTAATVALMERLSADIIHMCVALDSISLDH